MHTGPVGSIARGRAVAGLLDEQDTRRDRLHFHGAGQVGGQVGGRAAGSYRAGDTLLKLEQF